MSLQEQIWKDRTEERMWKHKQIGNVIWAFFLGCATATLVIYITLL